MFRYPINCVFYPDILDQMLAPLANFLIKVETTLLRCALVHCLVDLVMHLPVSKQMPRNGLICKDIKSFSTYQLASL